jgi:hypothetical protein
MYKVVVFAPAERADTLPLVSTLPLYVLYVREMVGSLKMNTALEYSTRVVQEGDRRCKRVLLTI